MKKIFNCSLIILHIIFFFSLLRNEQSLAQNLGPQSMALHTVGLHADGTVYSWGHNQYGQLGDNTTNWHYTPIKVIKGDYDGTTYLGDNTNNKIIAVALGYHHSIALAEDGTVYSWGENMYGQLGDSTTTQRNTPIKVLKGAYGGTTYLGDNTNNKIIAVALGYYHSIALTADGTVYSWGHNQYGQLGDSTTTQRNTPIKVHGVNDFGYLALPVELTSFTSNILSSGVELKWQTATEVNNYGFDVERSTDNHNWTILGFVAGNGNSNSPKDYSFVDEDIKNQVNGKYYYRLKQIDTDGSYKYSETIEVNWTNGITDVNDDSNLPKEFSLSQNYPNPFNPTTKIKYTITASPKSSPKERTFVRLIVYDVLGNEIANLVNEEKAPGEYEVEFSGKGLSSGMYFYKIEAGNFVQVKKMILMK